MKVFSHAEIGIRKIPIPEIFVVEAVEVLAIVTEAMCGWACSILIVFEIVKIFKNWLLDKYLLLY